MSTWRIERIGNSKFEFRTLNVIHQLPLIHARAADQLFECDVIKDGADGAIHFCPDRSEMAGCRFAEIIIRTRFNLPPDNSAASPRSTGRIVGSEKEGKGPNLSLQARKLGRTKRSKIW